MLHITPVTITAKAAHVVGDCSTGLDSTSGGTFNGSVIDRQALGGTMFMHAQPFLVASVPGTTSTQGARYRSVAIKLRHGDSSGGGDLADYLTPPAAEPFYTTQGESTDWQTWTTGTLRYQSSSVCYPLLGAKRFITAAGTITAPGLSTSTAGGVTTSVALGVNMIKADSELPGEISYNPGGNKGVYPTTSTAT